MSPALVQEWSVPPGAAWSLVGFYVVLVCFFKWFCYEYRNENSLLLPLVMSLYKMHLPKQAS